MSRSEAIPTMRMGQEQSIASSLGNSFRSETKDISLRRNDGCGGTVSFSLTDKRKDLSNDGR